MKGFKKKRITCRANTVKFTEATGSSFSDLWINSVLESFSIDPKKHQLARGWRTLPSRRVRPF